jgi:hypothetical protein
MRRPLLLLAFLLQACDKPAVPPVPKPPPVPQGTLRLDRSAINAWDIVTKADPGYPSLAVRMTYAGPKTYLFFHREAWHQGKRIGEERKHQSFPLPLNDDLALGFSDGKDKEGKDVVQVHESLPVKSKVAGDANFSRTGSTTELVLTPLKMRSKRTVEPAWPLEIADGTEALLWAVFVDEPKDVPAGATPEERARRADAAFLFRIRTADEKK